jgi:GntR family transcriptional repressor for pyruvate dehydrogenase complex
MLPQAMTNYEPGERLADRVYGQLLEFIVEQNLDQGDRLPSEHELARLTAVSRPIVREALTRLQADGLIESRRGAGSFLRQRPAPRQIQHLRPAQVRARLDAFEVRIALEPAAARLAALHRTEEELQTMKAAIEALAASHAAAEPGGAHDLLLHQTIAGASRNAMFLVALEALEAEVDGIIVPSLALIAEGPQQRARRVELEHVAIVEGIERGEPDCAEAAMRLHLLNARSRAMNMRW